MSMCFEERKVGNIYIYMKILRQIKNLSYDRACRWKNSRGYVNSPLVY